MDAYSMVRGTNAAQFGARLGQCVVVGRARQW